MMIVVLVGIVVVVEDIDCYVWLEDVIGDKLLFWVKEQNVKFEVCLVQILVFKQMEICICEVFDFDVKIFGVQKIGDYYYNFWKDQQYECGLWWCIILVEYCKVLLQWEIVFDLDVLNKVEGENWVWYGVDCLCLDYSCCLIVLLCGGVDVDVICEFDLVNKIWIKDGFFCLELKGGFNWVDCDIVFVYIDFGVGMMIIFGYLCVVKLWKCGMLMVLVMMVYEGKLEDMYIVVMYDDILGFECNLVSCMLVFYNNEFYLCGDDGMLIKIDVLNLVEKGLYKQWLILELCDLWIVGGKIYVFGLLLVIKLDDFLVGKCDFEVLFILIVIILLVSVIWIRSYLVLNVLDDVKNCLLVLILGVNGWQISCFVGVFVFGMLGVVVVDSNDSDVVWLIVIDYLILIMLVLVEIGQVLEILKIMLVFFDVKGKVIEQYFVISKDGICVLYFVVYDRVMKFDGFNLMLLYGYGGFEILLILSYFGGMGCVWLEKGGVYVVVNIRGGGEYGLCWYQVVLKQNCYKVYEDMVVVVWDLVKCKIISVKYLGVQGGSNGGLLIGNMLIQYLELFGVVVVQVFLLDMKCYSYLLVGVLWMVEYGNLDISDWEFIKIFLLYYLFNVKKNYLLVLFMILICDDCVYLGYVCKMVVKMIDVGKDVIYYENIEGGYGGVVNNVQVVYMLVLVYSFLWEWLGGK